MRITGSMVGIIGLNGSGKSNCLSGIGDIITGEFSRKKDRLVSWGAESGLMELEIRLNDGRLITVSREIPNGKATLQLPEHPLIKGADAVNSQILELLSTEKSILQNVVFVKQRAIESLLFGRDGIKDRLAQKFFGVERANQLEAQLGKASSAIAFDSASDRLTELTTRQVALREQLGDARQSRAALGSWIPDERIQELRQRSQDSHKKSQAILLHQQYSAQQPALREAVRVSREALEIQEQAIGRIDPVQIETLLATQTTQEAENREIRRLDIQLVEVEGRLQNLGEAPVGQAELDNRFAETARLEQECRDLAAKIAERDIILKEIGTNPICPTCHQEIDLSKRGPIEEELAEMKKRYRGLYGEYQAAKTVSDESTQKMSLYRRSLEGITAQLQQSRDARARLGQLHIPEPDPARIRQIQTTYFGLREKLMGLRQKAQEAEIAFNNNTSSMNLVASQALDPQGNYWEPGNAEVLLQEAQQISAQNDLIRAADSAVALLEQEYRQMEERALEARAAHEENSIKNKLKAAIVTLQTAFHPNGSPRKLVSRATKKLEERVNGYLVDMGAKFSATATNGMSFDYLFPSGIASDDDLSVGNQVMMSWAFRLAAFETFSSSVGLMTLDEPTAPLDKEAKLNFSHLIEKIKEMAEQQGMQFFISTHDEALVPCCDQVIKF